MPNTASPGAAQTEPDDVLSIILHSWLQEQEHRYRHILFVADGEWSEWTRRCLAQSDRILLVGPAGGDPAIRTLERYCNPRTRKELVLMHDDGTAEPSGTLAWLAARDVAAHHHLRWNAADHWARLAPPADGPSRGHGLQRRRGAGPGPHRRHPGFGGGRAAGGLHRRGQRGHFMGGAWATGLTPAEGMQLAVGLANPASLIDRTFPYTAVMASAKVTAVIREVLGKRQIEDLWRPFFCVSTNLSTATPVIHERGSLWRSVRSSIALPGIFTEFEREK